MRISLILVGLGGLFQAGGVALVFVEVRKALKAIRDYVTRPQSALPSTPLGVVGANQPRIITDPAPPIDDRVARLEEHLYNLSVRVDEAAPQLRQDVHQDVERRAHQVAEVTRAEIAKLADLVFGLQPKHLWRNLRTFGAGLIFVGVVLSTVGSCMSAG